MSIATEQRPESSPSTPYEVLRIARDGFDKLSKDDLRAAYHRALLNHHPDKTPHVDSSSALINRSEHEPTPRYSIDDIVTAYEILSDPKKRIDYDHSQEQRQDEWKTLNGHQDTHLGVESLDLEDLEYDETKAIWSKGCRCGAEQGYILTELDLEKESQHGEIYVGCQGCSLFIKVHFAVEET